MSMCNINILTVRYPYGKGEEFIESELAVLSKEYKSIKIYPAFDNNKQKSVPENVLVSNDLNKNSILNIIFGLSGFKYIFQDLLRELTTTNVTIKKLLVIIVYIYRGMRVFGNYKKNAIHNEANELYYCYWANSEAYGSSLIKKVYPDKFNYILRAHGSDLYISDYTKRYLPFRNIIYENCLHVFTVSDHGKKYLSNRYSCLSDKITTARLGVKRVVKKQNIIDTKDSSAIHFVSCSNDAQVKRINLIRDLIVKISKKESKEVIWSHIGIDKNIFYLKYANQEIPRNCTIIAMGIMNNSEVLDFYRNTDLDYFVNLSSSEGVPVSIMEALSASIPVIATNVGGVDELIDKNVGMLVEKDVNLDDLAAMIIGQHKNHDSQSENAFKRWDKLANADKNYQKFATDILKLHCICK